jgi:mercuric ion transport protein
MAMKLKGTLAVGVLAGLGASVCCVGPLLLLSLGIGGAWIGNLTALEPYRPIFICLTLLFIGLAFRKLYLMPQACEPGTACVDTDVIRRQRLMFWIVAPVLIALLLVPWLLPFIYR